MRNFITLAYIGSYLFFLQIAVRFGKRNQPLVANCSGLDARHFHKLSETQRRGWQTDGILKLAC